LEESFRKYEDSINVCIKMNKYKVSQIASYPQIGEKALKVLTWTPDGIVRQQNIGDWVFQ
jgi:hypothetical protein